MFVKEELERYAAQMLMNAQTFGAVPWACMENKEVFHGPARICWHTAPGLAAPKDAWAKPENVQQCSRQDIEAWLDCWGRGFN